jgi:hypothetical protein
MVYFLTKNPNLGKFWSVHIAMEDVGIFYGHLVYFTAIWYMLLPFVYFVVFWYIFPRFGMFYQEKSGNPEPSTRKNEKWTIQLAKYRRTDQSFKTIEILVLFSKNLVKSLLISTLDKAIYNKRNMLTWLDKTSLYTTK